MSKYTISGSYTSQGNKGLMAEGGSGRVDALRETIKSVGGTLDSMYWGFGSEDWYIFADLPNNVVAAAVSLTVSASGSVSVRTTAIEPRLATVHARRGDLAAADSHLIASAELLVTDADFLVGSGGDIAMRTSLLASVQADRALLAHRLGNEARA